MLVLVDIVALSFNTSHQWLSSVCHHLAKPYLLCLKIIDEQAPIYWWYHELGLRRSATGSSSTWHPHCRINSQTDWDILMADLYIYMCFIYSLYVEHPRATQSNNIIIIIVII